MNTPNAFGFVALGLLMKSLPQVAPSLVAGVLAPGEGSRELWLAFMGAVLVFTGGAFLLRSAWQWTIRPRPVPMLRPAMEPAPTWVRPRRLASRPGPVVIRRAGA